MPLTGPERVLRGKIAAHTRWSKTIDRTEATTSLRAGFDRRFVVQVDPENQLPADVQAVLVNSARAAYFTRLAFLRVKAANKKKARKARNLSGTGADDGAADPRHTP